MTRLEAIAAGLATYTRDTPCKHGNEPIFIVSQWACRECRRIRDRENYEKKTAGSTKPTRQRKSAPYKPRSSTPRATQAKPAFKINRTVDNRVSSAKGSAKAAVVADRRSAEDRAAAMELLKLAPVPDFIALCEARMMQGRVGQ